MFKKILIAIDSSEPAARALERGVELAKQTCGELVVAHVIDLTSAEVPEFGVVDKQLLADAQHAGAELLSTSIAKLPAGVKVQPRLLHGDPAESIVTAAREWNADLIIMGSDSRGRVTHFLLGSTADAVIRRASCPVMTVRQQPAHLEAHQGIL